ncbi:MAG: peptide chain release factor N(5)-glutamine methyltransferase [Prevotella sp.]|nr:peptide chain release factor N(5)-glutamine methyltransferase [Prevotella sp.]
MKYETLWRRLASIYDTDEAKAIVRWMLDVRFGLSLTDIVCGKTDELNEEECAELEGMMQRLEKGEPVQYVMGVAEFCGRRFHVEPGVLIPRPETGELCEMILEVRGKRREVRDYQILDIGTGSGCIAITLALEMPQANVTAWDISEKALRIAKKNADTLAADMTFEQHDILEFESHLEAQNISLTSHLSPLTSKSFDLIVSNPPYICNREKATMERHVLEHEPHLALFVPNDVPLLFYRAITHFAKEALKPNGLLYFELNPLYACETEAMVRELGFSETEIKLDMFGKQRFLKAKKI